MNFQLETKLNLKYVGRTAVLEPVCLLVFSVAPVGFVEEI